MEVEYDDATKENPAEFRSVYRPKRETFYRYEENGFWRVKKKLFIFANKQRIKMLLRRY